MCLRYHHDVQLSVSNKSSEFLSTSVSYTDLVTVINLFNLTDDSSEKIEHYAILLHQRTEHCFKF